MTSPCFFIDLERTHEPREICLVMQDCSVEEKHISSVNEDGSRMVKAMTAETRQVLVTIRSESDYVFQRSLRFWWLLKKKKIRYLVVMCRRNLVQQCHAVWLYLCAEGSADQENKEFKDIDDVVNSDLFFPVLDMFM